MTSQTQSQITNEILQGNLIKLMFKLSVPSILGILMLNLNSFIDALFVGRFIGENALAGISLAIPLTTIVTGFAGLIGVGSASVLSRAIGSEDLKTQSKIFGNIIVLSIIISSFITFIGYIFGQELIGFMGGNSEVTSEGTKYLKIYVLGSIFLILGEAFGEVINSEGNIRLNTIFNLIFVSVNILLNYIFITVYNWKIQGVAIATVIAMLVSCILNLSYFIAGKSIIPVHLKKIAFAIDLLPKILSVGVSSLSDPVMILIQDFVTYNLIADYGKNIDIAFFGATIKVNSLMFIPIIGFAQALQPVIGINYGAKNYVRIKKAYLIFAIIGAILLLLIWLPLQIIPNVFLNLILPDVNFTTEDMINFRIISILIPIWPLAYCSNTLFLSIGKPQVVLLAIFLRTIVLNVPMVILFSKIIGLRGIYIGLALADFIFMLLVFFLTAKEFSYLSKRNY